MIADAGRRRAEAAMALLGCRFRLRGRDPATGLDCVGVVAAALRGGGGDVSVPSGYRLQLRALEPWRSWAAGNGYEQVEGAGEAGDIGVWRVSPDQVHLGICLGAGEIVHAHAGLGRVVRSAVPDAWTALGCWRPVQGENGKG